MTERATIGIAFEDAKLPNTGATLVRRDAAKMTITRSGSVRGNTEGKEFVCDFVRRNGGDPANFQLTYKGAEALGVMGLYLTKQGDIGVMNVKLHPHSINFHAGGCFVEWPKLRPTTTVDCFMEETVDAKGNPCIAVHVTAGTPTRTVRRVKKSVAAAKAAPPAETGEESQG
jgi:hypothetical protein